MQAAKLGTGKNLLENLVVDYWLFFSASLFGLRYAESSGDFHRRKNEHGRLGRVMKVLVFHGSWFWFGCHGFPITFLSFWMFFGGLAHHLSVAFSAPKWPIQQLFLWRPSCRPFRNFAQRLWTVIFAWRDSATFQVFQAFFCIWNPNIPSFSAWPPKNGGANHPK